MSAPRFDTIDVNDATLEQITFHCAYSEIDLPADADIDVARQAMKDSGYKQIRIMLPEKRRAKRAGSFDDASTHEYDPDRERWVRCQIRQDRDADPQDRSPVYVGVNDDYAWVPVNVDVIIRERLYVHLITKEYRVFQEDGTARFSEARRIAQERYPNSFLGYAGYVSDGPPKDIPDDTFLIAPGGTQAAAVALSRSASMRASFVNG